MLVYLDMCCLKRPFDDQSQARIHLETEAVLGLLSAEAEGLRFVRSPALVLENSRNPVPDRAARVAQWLESAALAEVDPTQLRERTAALMDMGFGNFDALHIASAELARAEVLATCDDRLVAAGMRNAARIKVRIAPVLELAREVMQ